NDRARRAPAAVCVLRSEQPSCGTLCELRLQEFEFSGGQQHERSADNRIDLLGMIFASKPQGHETSVVALLRYQVVPAGLNSANDPLIDVYRPSLSGKVGMPCTSPAGQTFKNLGGYVWATLLESRQCLIAIVRRPATVIVLQAEQPNDTAVSGAIDRGQPLIADFMVGPRQ